MASVVVKFRFESHSYCVALVTQRMANDSDPTVNTRVPQELLDRIDEVYDERGFSNRSEFIRSALRDAVNAPSPLSEEAKSDLAVSRSQIDEDQTTSFDEVLAEAGLDSESIADAAEGLKLETGESKQRWGTELVERVRDTSARLFGSKSDDYELYEEDDTFVLTVDIPGFRTDDIDLTWDEGVLNIAAEKIDEKREQKRTYHRRFRFPETINENEITAEYYNGVLKVTLPLRESITEYQQGHRIEGNSEIRLG